MQNFLSSLNKQQQAAVTLPIQSALVLAGAGSGKTRVLTTRIAWLIEIKKISPYNILAVTFTNKAAKEILERLSIMIPTSSIKGIWIGTFHGLCNRLLRIHYRDVALPQNFQILDIQDQLLAIKHLLKLLNINDEKYPPRSLMYFINKIKEQGLRAKNIYTNSDYNQEFIKLYEKYDQQCQRDGVVDFVELLLRTYDLLSCDVHLQTYYQTRFRHILVDEFQDTNNLQYKWLKLLAGQGKMNCNTIFAVGDDDQSIYAFRGANINNLTIFKKDFQIKNLIKLEQNYRSYGYILNAANVLIANNSKRIGKNLHTNAGYGEQICIFEFYNDLQEAQWIVRQIKNLMKKGVSGNEIAILYRSNAQSRIIENALFAAAIKYRIYGGGHRFFERAEIKYAIAYLQLIDNPHNNSAFLRVVNFPTRGIGIKTLEYLQNIARIHNCSLYIAVSYMSNKNHSSLITFMKLIENTRTQILDLTLEKIVQLVLDISGLNMHYQNKKEFDRIVNLTQLVDIATWFISKELDTSIFFEQNNIQSSITTILTADNINTVNNNTLLASVKSCLSAFLSHISLVADDDTQLNHKKNILQLMTVHSAKGLEFDVVFITGLEEGLFPYINQTKQNNDIEEERRLMYVAITRARKQLYLTFSQARILHGQMCYNIRSRFLNELPHKSVKWLSLK